ncbi:MAG: DUF4230 domain-containing protein [Porphyromonas sp.]|nr:DUF4230 domain-containing protein [Porphyromonas sp.]
MSRLNSWMSYFVLVLLSLSFAACSQKEEKEETPPVQLLLIQAQSLSRLELATTQVRIVLKIDPHRDGFLGFKKLFGSKETRVELLSQASAYCDLSQLTEKSIVQQADSTVDLYLPPIEVKRELDNLNHNVLQEPTGLRRRLSTNELDEIIRSRQTMIDGLVAKALEQERGALIRTASATLTNKLQPIFRDLRLTVRVHLDEADASLIQSSKSAAQ